MPMMNCLIYNKKYNKTFFSYRRYLYPILFLIVYFFEKWSLSKNDYIVIIIITTQWKNVYKFLSTFHWFINTKSMGIL